MTWVVENWGLILTVSGAVLTLAAVVARFTVTKVDDKIVDALRTIVGLAGGSAPLGKGK
ncbi:MAG TPA: hypothetical protein VIY48_16515 [Candidatus Paceibacterota bacterium]